LFPSRWSVCHGARTPTAGRTCACRLSILLPYLQASGTPERRARRPSDIRLPRPLRPHCGKSLRRAQPTGTVARETGPDDGLSGHAVFRCIWLSPITVQEQVPPGGSSWPGVGGGVGSLRFGNDLALFSLSVLMYRIVRRSALLLAGAVMTLASSVLLVLWLFALTVLFGEYLTVSLYWLVLSCSFFPGRNRVYGYWPHSARVVSSADEKHTIEGCYGVRVSLSALEQARRLLMWLMRASPPSTTYSLLAPVFSAGE
jgi:hypothetical protein